MPPESNPQFPLKFQCDCVPVEWHRCEGKPKGRSYIVSKFSTSSTTTYYELGPCRKCTCYPIVVVEGTSEAAKVLITALAQGGTRRILKKEKEVRNVAHRFVVLNDTDAPQEPFAYMDVMDPPTQQCTFVVVNPEIEGVHPSRLIREGKELNWVTLGPSLDSLEVKRELLNGYTRPVCVYSNHSDGE